MAGVGIATSSAMRRRQRRLRQWHRHERMTVAMALAEATHHAAPRGPKTARAQEEVERETYNVPRQLKKSSPGTLPAPPAEVAGSQEGAVTDGYVAAPLPLVSSPILAGGDATDDVTVAFLVAAALEEKDEEEKARVRRQREAAENEARMRELDRRVQNDVPLSPAESRAWMKWMRWAGHLPPKKRKKRRKTRTSAQTSQSKTCTVSALKTELRPHKLAQA